MSSECEAFEIAIERESYGATSKEESAALADHLASCMRCRAYAAEVVRSRRGLAAMASAARSDVDWTKLETALRNGNTRRLRRVLSLSLIAPTAIGLSLWGLTPTGQRLETLIFDTIIVGLIVGARIVSVTRRTRQLARLTERANFFAEHRAELVRDIRRAETFRWIALGVLAALVALGAWMPDPTGHGRLVYGILAAILVATWGQRLLVELPRQRRELASIEETAGELGG